MNKKAENTKSVKEIIDKIEDNQIVHKRSKGDEEKGLLNWLRNIKYLKTKIAIGVVALIVITYCGVGYIKYNGKFLPNTIINGTDFSGMGVDEVCDYYEDKIKGYSLDIYHSSYIIDKITPEKIDLELSYKAKWYFAGLVKKQSNIMWLPAIWGKTDIYDVNYMDIMCYNVHKLNFFIADSVGYNLPVTIKSRQGSIYFNGNNFQIVPPVESDQIEPATYIQKVYSKVQELLPKMVIEEEECYIQNNMTPEIEEKLNQACDIAEEFFGSRNMNISLSDYDYDFNSEVINAVYNISADYDFICNEDTIDRGIDAIKERYNTVGRDRTFSTSHGYDVTVSGGDYGSYIDTTFLRSEVKRALLNKEDVNSVIDYKRNTLDEAVNDIGNTYVEIDLTNQYLYMYVNGELVKDCPIVSGLPGGRATPQGVYRLKNKIMDVPLVGANYVTPVKYWMPFNGGIGMHDAVWQSAFGGDRYKRKGSHGCINLSMTNARDIYKNAIVNMPVVCYYGERDEVFKELPSTDPVMGQYRGLTANEYATLRRIKSR